jgi:salicylate hydroxylase
MAVEPPILIAGGGIGGLAAAIALARAGQSVHVLERRAQTGEEGAGIQLGPNGVRVLRLLGADRLLEPSVGRPYGIAVFNGRTGRELTTMPLAGWAEARWGAPYWVARRADLHEALHQRALAEARIRITPGYRVTRIEDLPNGLCLRDERNVPVVGRALIGADGLHSMVAQLRIGAPRPRFIGKTAARALVPAAGAGKPFSDHLTGLWLGPKAHLVHYPVRGGEWINLVAVTEDRWQGEGWSEPIAGAELAGRFAGWCRPIRELVAGAADWQRWAVHARAPLGTWSRDRVTLLGDAAHPLSPFLAQGGVLALEDAEALGRAVGRAPRDLAAAFLAYERERLKRTGRVVRASLKNGRTYHLSGPSAAARDLVLRLTPPRRLLARYDWLYGFAAPGAGAAAPVG